ncbi:MAG TPA: DUF6152 family protein [Steroidobacteraceae bacterium]|jgi:hypothetical protein|nr:DUF6152 family protein [Steroidobacteraceae bacterium]
MNMLKQAAVAMVLALGTFGLADAHHADNSQFNANKSAVFTGVLSRMYIGNPHSYLYFTRMVNDQQQNWTFETEAVLALRRAGLSVRDSLKVGSSYSLVFSPALDGSSSGLMTAIKLADGRVIAFLTKNNVDTANKLLNEKLLDAAPQSGQPSNPQ